MVNLNILKGGVESSATRRAAFRAQLQVILSSSAFRNTEVLKRLLEYLADQALSEDGRDLKEYTVGIEAFGKPPEYDPKTDSSVRVLVGKLRQKLDEYYRTQGLNDSVLVQLPKGRFRLEFQDRASLGSQAPPPRNRHKVLIWSLVAIAFTWASAATFAALHNRRQEAISERYNSPDIAVLWNPFFQSGRPTIVSLGTPLFAKISGDFFRSPTLNNVKSLDTSEDLKRIEGQLGGRAIPAYPYTGVGEASAAFELARLFLSSRKDINLVLSSALTWEDVGRNNIVFVGPPKFNLYESELPVEQDFMIQHGRLENLHPRAGEPEFFAERWSPDQSQLMEGYALIARLPGLHGAGYMMVLASTSTEGTRAAVEYVTRSEYAAQLIRALRQSGETSPKYFEAVVRAQFRSQTPIQVKQVAVHVLH